MEVACGQCFGCRLDRTLMWAMRIVHESYLYIDQCGNCFITLTYSDKHECTKQQLKDGYYCPDDLSLNKEHFKKFIKRLRKSVPQKIRYFHCGEYGDENLRPHYHACMFNCSFDDEIVFEDKEGLISYTSKSLAKLWPYGFSTVAEVNFNTAAYVAGYILKKITGLQAKEAYLRSDEYGVALWVTAPYVTMSLGRKKPGGIGAQFYEKYKSDFYPCDEVPIPGLGVRKKVPRYYDKILAEENPELLELVKAYREQFIKEHAADFTPERLKDKYVCARKRQLLKKRNL